MKYRYLQVPQQLTDYVRTILVLNDRPDFKSSDLPLFTKGTAALLCAVKDSHHSITLYGQSVPDEHWTLESGSGLIAFFFKPFAIGTIFKVSAQELKNSPVPLNLWNPQKAMALGLQLLHHTSMTGKIDTLSHFIGSQIRHNQRECEIVRTATDRLMQNPDAQALAQIPAELHLTERTFQRIFKKYVGIPANEYRRICQFYFAFSQLKGGHFDKQADVAYHNGYFDQSHYIRSFKEFTDTTPNDYLKSGLPRKKE